MKYLLIGNGRVATHLAHYFALQGIQFRHWHRQEQNAALDLKKFIDEADVVLLAISDRSIEDFYREHLTQKKSIHFSGSYHSEAITGWHPLFTFGDNLYSHDSYQKIPFIGVKDTFSSDFPDLPNPHHLVSVEHKPLYHALCVLSGNFTTLLWQKCIEEFQKIGLKASAIQPYQKQVFDNSFHHLCTSLTGPLVRNDIVTIKNNVKALKNEELQKLYIDFVKLYSKQLAQEIL